MQEVHHHELRRNYEPMSLDGRSLLTHAGDKISYVEEAYCQFNFEFEGKRSFIVYVRRRGTGNSPGS